MDLENSTNVSSKDHKQNSLIMSTAAALELDAGALFVLKSRGSWLHCGYHFVTAIVGPVLLTLPYTLTLLGWVGGLVCLTLTGLVTFYAYNLLSVVLEHHAHQGRRQVRFRDMARDILGPGWAKYYVGPLQLAVCYGSVIGGPLLSGQSLKYIYLLYNPNGKMELYQFVIICGAVILVLAQLPSFHSLRHINLISLILCLAYSLAATVGSIHIGYSKDAPPKTYAVNGATMHILFGVFNGISIISTTFGCGIVPEIQATIALPVKGKMFRALCLCYAVIATTFLSVAISGYWAFGNASKVSILANFMGDGKPLLPTWSLVMTNLFTVTQVLAVSAVYLQPMNELFETMFANVQEDQFSLRNVAPRLICRSVSVMVATFLGAMLPFFGDIVAIFGAFGTIPLDFILPMIFYNLTFKPSKKSFIYWGNTIIAMASSVLVGIGAVASIRQIVLDAKTYHLFANM